MKVVMIVSNPLRPERPDPRVYREGQALLEAGHEVSVIAWDRLAEFRREEELSGLHVHRIQVRAQYGSGTGLIRPLRKFWREARKLVGSLDWDVIHCHDLDTLPVGYQIAHRQDKPVIFDAHESYPDFIAPRVPAIVTLGVSFMERYYVRRVSAVITVGETLAEKYRRIGAKIVEVVGNWHDPDTLALSPERIAAIRNKLGAQGLFVVYVGGFGANRALLELVEAVCSVGGVFLVLAGDGQQRPEIERAITGCSRIRYLGVIPYNRALELKGAADVVYRVARVEQTPNAQYSAPNNLFEALAGGTAVIASDNGDMGRIVREEGCGIVLNRVTANQIAEALQALQDLDVLNRMKRNGLRAAERRYNWTEATARLTGLYERVVNS